MKYSAFTSGTTDKRGSVDQSRLMKRYPMPVEELQVGMYVSGLDRPWDETPFLLQGFRIEDQENIDEIARYCDYVYINTTEQDIFLAQTKKSVSYNRKVEASQGLGLNVRDVHSAIEVHASAKSLTSSFMDDVQLGKAIDMKKIESTVSGCLESILHNQDAMLWVSRIRQKDKYTSEHVLNVCILAIIFSRYLGASEEDMKKVGICGLLHDVGKMQVPIDILQKDGPLTPEEARIMRLHPGYGRDILMADRSVPHVAIDVCYSHHEALDGSGYPRKLKASGLSEMTRMITICDVYDAITSDRPYRNGASSFKAMQTLYQNRGKKFDGKFVMDFIKCIGLHPIGSLVELRSGELALVISTNHAHRDFPKILVVADSDHNRCKEFVVDLDKARKNGKDDKLIRQALPNGFNGIRIEKYIEAGLKLR